MKKHALNKLTKLNFLGAKVEDEFLEQFVSNNSSDDSKNMVYGWFEKKNDLESNQPLFLNIQLVKLCQVIKQGDPGYNRLIFFIAIVSGFFLYWYYFVLI